ncbi:MAG: beta-ketoacyl-ACP synthase II [Bryobacteraceae bacterium]|nr:beta-ketoacyl-ACP synthase II [Bryobacteraceae bacterium]MCX7605203.1 beta-ketoacyl-ACP synthase II [Bryobacteraceae bacterium]
MARRVVVTGVGVISALGNSAEETWQAVLASKCGIGPITQFDCSQFAARIAAEVKNFDPLQYFEKKELKKVGRFIQFAVAASEEALKSARLEVTPDIAEMTGVYIGSGIGAFEVIEREHRVLLEKGPDRISPFFIPASIVNLASGNVSIRTGAKGPNSATATACTTSAHCIGDSFRLIQHGYADVMICGGAEACITPMGIGGFAAMRALSTRNEEPERASRPWDRDRDGFVVGEGAGILILEELEFARRRGAPILAEIVGYGMSGDAYHITAPCEDGDGAYRVMRNAIRDAGITPEQIDYVNAHGTSTPVGDVIECIALKKTFGEHAYRLAVSSTKSMTGHLLGGAGGLEAALTVFAIRDQIAPPTINLDNPDEQCDLDFVPHKARPMKIEYALSNSFGFGGTNGSLIFRRFSE